MLPWATSQAKEWHADKRWRDARHFRDARCRVTANQLRRQRDAARSTEARRCWRAQPTAGARGARRRLARELGGEAGDDKAPQSPM